MRMVLIINHLGIVSKYDSNLNLRSPVILLPTAFIDSKILKEIIVTGQLQCATHIGYVFEGRHRQVAFI